MQLTIAQAVQSFIALNSRLVCSTKVFFPLKLNYNDLCVIPKGVLFKALTLTLKASMEEEENYFVRNGCVDKVLEAQTARDEVVVSFPSDHEAVFSGFKILDLDILKQSGIARYHFTFEPTAKTVVVTATLQDTAVATAVDFVRRRNRGPVRIGTTIKLLF